MIIEKLINAVGVLGVIASLIFVGLELQQSQRIALGTAAQARLDALAAPRLAAIQTAPNAYKISGGQISEIQYSAMTDDEKIIWRSRTATGALNLQNAWLQNELGLLPPILWEQAEDRALGGWKNCLTRPILSGQLTADFKEYLAERITKACD
tara:strand:+ start:170 stop:628 length:459 start_codon:yes stop_codon:yes gene_type:complete